MPGIKPICVEVEAPLLPGGLAYMRLRDDRDMAENVVVWFDARRFMDFWLKHDRTKTAIRTAEWSASKRDHDVACMVEGLARPVPLGAANFYIAGDGEIIFGFSDGMSRTAVLVDYGAYAVPLVMLEDEARGLLQHVPGYIDTAPWQTTRGETDFSNDCYEENLMRKAWRARTNRMLAAGALVTATKPPRNTF